MNKYIILRIGLNFLELSAALTGFICWKKIRDYYWKWFAVYLAIIFFTEITAEFAGYIMGWLSFNRNIYKFFGIPFQFLFFFWLFKKEFSIANNKNWPLIGVIVYMLSLVIDIAYLSNFKFIFFSFSYLVGNIILLLFTILFFIKFMKGNEILQYKSSMMFWVCLGLLVFYLLSLPFYGLWNTLIKYPSLFNNYWILTTGFDYLMYLFFVISFIWGKPK